MSGGGGGEGAGGWLDADGDGGEAVGPRRRLLHRAPEQRRSGKKEPLSVSALEEGGEWANLRSARRLRCRKQAEAKREMTTRPAVAPTAAGAHSICGAITNQRDVHATKPVSLLSAPSVSMGRERRRRLGFGLSQGPAGGPVMWATGGCAAEAACPKARLIFEGCPWFRCDPLKSSFR